MVDDLPTQAEVEEALLRLLKSRAGPISPSEAYDALADTFGLTDEQRRRTMASGERNHWRNRVQWAKNELAKRRMLARVSRGQWKLAAEERSGENWSEDEVSILVSDYFAMLKAEVEGRRYSKSEHRKQLMSIVKRSATSIERKHMNVSAVLREHGFPWIAGYKPLPNYQRTILPKLVLPHLEVQGVTLDKIVPTIVLPETVAPLFTPPPREGVRLPEPSDPIARKFDVAERDARNRDLGSAGEEFVVEVERRRLTEAGCANFQSRVERVSKSEGDGLGYDIVSCDNDGATIYIEVKTTRGSVQAPFYITETERRVSEERGGAYRLYRVYEFDRNPKIYVLSGPVEQSLNLQATVYRAGVRPNVVGPLSL